MYTLKSKLSVFCILFCEPLSSIYISFALSSIKRRSSFRVGGYSPTWGRASIINFLEAIYGAGLLEKTKTNCDSPHGAPIGDGWYEEGVEAVFSVESSTGLIPQHVFTGWSGDHAVSSPTSSITMDGPKSVTATWGTSYTNLYYAICLAIITVIAIILMRVSEVADFLHVPS